MFRELLAISVLFPSLAVAQNNLTDEKPKPLVTPEGKPLGAVVTATIDSKGRQTGVSVSRSSGGKITAR